MQSYEKFSNNSNFKLSAKENEIECHDEKCLGCLSPSCKCDIDEKFRNNCVLNENEGSKADFNGCEIELEFDSLETAFPIRMRAIIL